MKIASLVALLILLSGCFGPSFTTLDTNLPEGRYQSSLKLFFLRTPEDAERAGSGGWLLAELQKSGSTDSSQSLISALQENSFKCKRLAPAVVCRGEFYRTERVSGGPNDGVGRVDWFVSVQWQDTPGPVRPEIRGGQFKLTRIQ
jgi:hypothetical protein